MFIRPLILGFITVGVSVVLMKSFETSYAYNNTYAVFWPGVGDWQKWVLIGRFVWGALAGLSWGGLWLLAVAILMAQRAKWIRGEIGLLVQFIVLYIIFFFPLYC